MSWDKIPGWAAFADTYKEYLDHHAHDGDVVVETGVLFGRSLTMLHEGAVERGLKLSINGVDPFEDNGHWLPATHPYRDIAESLGGPYAAFCALMFQHAPKTLDAVRVHRMTSVDARKLFADKSCAMVLIDDAHSYEGCLASIAAWRSAVKGDGILAGDDYDPTGFPGVVRAVKQSFGDDYHVQGTTWIAGKTPLAQRRRRGAQVSSPKPPPSQFDGSVDGLRREYNLESLPKLSGPVTLLDIGANEGNFTLYASRVYELSATCFEPHPDAFKILSARAAGSAFVTCVNAAVVHPRRAERVKLYPGVSGTHESSFRDDVRWPHLSQKLDEGIEVDAVDAASLPPCDILKVDTEGSEVEILTGYPHLKSVKILLVECHAVGGDLKGQMEKVAQLGMDAGLRPIDVRGTIIRFARDVDATKTSSAAPTIQVLDGFALDDNWVLVESASGTRWVGKAQSSVAEFLESHPPHYIDLSPAFEVAPSRIFFPMPRPGQSDMGIGELELSGVWSSTRSAGRKVRVRWASLEWLATLPKAQQDEWAKHLAGAMGVK